MTPTPKAKTPTRRRRRGEFPPLLVWASDAVDLVTELPYAVDLVGTLASQAQQALDQAGRT